jgi:hypothetical protein
MTWGSIYWPVWFFGGFLGAEIYALVTSIQDTLSVETWNFIDVNTWNPWHIGFAAFTAVFFIWLWLHLNFRILPGYG